MVVVIEKFGFWRLSGLSAGPGCDRRFGRQLHWALQAGRARTVTVGLFISLIKAFGTVPREALVAVLRRFGLSDQIFEVLMRLRCGAKTKVKIGRGDWRSTAPSASSWARAMATCFFSSSYIRRWNRTVVRRRGEARFHDQRKRR